MRSSRNVGGKRPPIHLDSSLEEDITTSVIKNSNLILTIPFAGASTTPPRSPGAEVQKIHLRSSARLPLSVVKVDAYAANSTRKTREKEPSDPSVLYICTHPWWFGG